jgi:tRNA G18 (ribose-2'-O)-methylase SpoU
VAIPLRGRVASLNVSVAAGVAPVAYTGRPGGLEQES